MRTTRPKTPIEFAIDCQLGLPPNGEVAVFIPRLRRSSSSCSDDGGRGIGRADRKTLLMISRTFAMPNAETFTVPPIGAFVKKYLATANVSVDPFARNRDWFTHTNDLNPATCAQHHMDAEAYLQMLAQKGVRADLGIFDPPYSPRQISECYAAIGLKVGSRETQNGRLYKRVRDALDNVVRPGGLVLSFGWQSAGMGKGRGYEIVEIALINHGGAHNDTICMAERKIAAKPQS